MRFLTLATQLRILEPGIGNILPSEGGRFLIGTLLPPGILFLPHRPQPGVSWFIYDADFNAAVNPIMIVGLFGEMINLSPLYVINGNGDSVEIFYTNVEDVFRAVPQFLTGSGSGGGTTGGIQWYDSNDVMALEPLYAVIRMFYSRGLSTPGDGGGGFYIFSPLDVTPPDGNIVVQSAFTPLGRFLKQQ